MKKLITITAMLVMVLVLAADLYASQRVVVAEDFTGTWCPYCPGAARGLDQLYGETADSLVVLAYHAGDPYSTAELNGRIAYYGDLVPGYPTVIFDGLDTVVGGTTLGTMYSYYRPFFDAHKLVASPFDISIGLIDHDLYLRNGTMEVKVKNTGATADSGILHFIVHERNIPEVWQGGLTEVDFVARDMIPDQNGQAFSLAAGDSLVTTRDFTIAPDWAFGNCQFVALVQRANKEIVQGSQLYGPSLSQISDSLTEVGNGNGFNEPGESLNLLLQVSNRYAPTTAAIVTASTPDTFVTITNGRWDIGAMAAGDTADNYSSPFAVNIKSSATMPEGHAVTVYIHKKIYSSLYQDTIVSDFDSVSFVVGSPAAIYFEDFEDGLADWKVGYTAYTTGTNWDTTQSDYHSANTCIVNSEFGDYANKQNRWIRMLNYIDLTSYSTAKLSWYEKYVVVAGDKCQPEVSTDSAGSTWSTLAAYYSGNVGSWQKRTVDITSYCNNKKYFRVGYRLLTDTINVAKGWHVDDMAIEGYRRLTNIWPGDCDNNSIVNGLDVLPIGMYWNAVGLSRPNASTNWTAQPGYFWPTVAASYVDCDGNGIVDIQDVLAIGQNWHQNHSKAKGKDSDIVIPENVDLRPYLNNYHEIYQGISGESEAVLEIKRVLENIFSQYSQKLQQFSMNIRPVSGYGSWKIECNIPKDTKLSLKIYNIMGQEVRIISNGEIKAGQHTWVWPGVNNEQRKVASGLYICRLEASGFNKTVKMVVVR